MDTIRAFGRSLAIGSLGALTMVATMAASSVHPGFGFAACVTLLLGSRLLERRSEWWGAFWDAPAFPLLVLLLAFLGGVSLSVGVAQSVLKLRPEEVNQAVGGAFAAFMIFPVPLGLFFPKREHGVRSYVLSGLWAGVVAAFGLVGFAFDLLGGVGTMADRAQTSSRLNYRCGSCGSSFSGLSCPRC